MKYINIIFNTYLRVLIRINNFKKYDLLKFYYYDLLLFFFCLFLIDETLLLIGDLDLNRFL